MLIRFTHFLNYLKKSINDRLFHSNPKFVSVTVPVGSGSSELLKRLVVGINSWLCLEVEFSQF